MVFFAERHQKGPRAFQASISPEKFNQLGLRINPFQGFFLGLPYIPTATTMITASIRISTLPLSGSVETL
jgi:hypothetical protein